MGAALHLAFWVLFWICAAELVLVAMPTFLVNLYVYGVIGRRPIPPGSAEVSLIKPLRGADLQLRANLETYASFPPSGPYQILLAMESKEDPAFAVAEDFRRAHPDLDIEIVIAGPSGPRMGKIHNMIEAYERAKHSLIMFSDGDVRIDTRTFPAAIDALTRADAAFFPCYYKAPGDAGSAAVALYTNHDFFLLLAPLSLTGKADFLWGGFMTVRRSALDEIGGLRPFERRISDDASLGHALAAKGKRIDIVPVPLLMPCEPESPKVAYEHLRRWGVMVRAFMGRGYFGFPAIFLGQNAVVAVFLGAACGHAALGLALLAAVFSFRLASSACLDMLLAGRLMPAWCYAMLFLCDLLSLPVWALPLFNDTIEWRGKRYRVLPSGEAVVC